MAAAPALRTALQRMGLTQLAAVNATDVQGMNTLDEYRL